MKNGQSEQRGEEISTRAREAALQEDTHLFVLYSEWYSNFIILLFRFFKVARIFCYYSFFMFFCGGEIIIVDMKAVIHLFIYLFIQNDLIRRGIYWKKKRHLGLLTSLLKSKSHIKQKSLFLFLEIKYILRRHCLRCSEMMVMTQELFHREKTNIALNSPF